MTERKAQAEHPEDVEREHEQPSVAEVKAADNEDDEEGSECEEKTFTHKRLRRKRWTTEERMRNSWSQYW